MELQTLNDSESESFVLSDELTPCGMADSPGILNFDVNFLHGLAVISSFGLEFLLFLAKKSKLDSMTSGLRFRLDKISHLIWQTERYGSPWTSYGNISDFSIISGALSDIVPEMLLKSKFFLHCISNFYFFLTK